MKAIAYTTFGNETVLKVTELEAPKLLPNEVRIKISHTSVNPVDWKIREGYLNSMFPHVFPIVPGWDAAGTIAEKGTDVTAFNVGDEVYAYTRLPSVQWGTYAESIAVPAQIVALKPKSLTLAEAAAVPLVGLTAFQILHDAGHVQKGQKVLVLGASGGVGSFAIPFAKTAGAHVTATAGKQNQGFIKELGADFTVDYTSETWESDLQKQNPNGFDLVLDLVGGETQAAGERLLGKSGQLVSIVDTPKKGVFHFVSPSGSQLKEIAELFDSKKIPKPSLHISNVKNAASEHLKSQARHTKGKVVLEVKF
jgi:NADPH:quinone reductase-like Zn-dependent oxidoreductase